MMSAKISRWMLDANPTDLDLVYFLFGMLWRKKMLLSVLVT